MISLDEEEKVFDRHGHTQIDCYNGSYNAGLLGRSTSLALELSPNLTPSLTLFRYSPFYVEGLKSAVFRPDQSIATFKERCHEYPTEMLLLMEYYPYTKEMVKSVASSVVSPAGQRQNLRLINEYPDLGYIRVHYLTARSHANGNFPERLNSAAMIDQFCQAAGIECGSYIGFFTEGIVSKQALQNLNFNIEHATAKSCPADMTMEGVSFSPTNLPLIARYIPEQVSFAAIRAWYERVCRQGASDYSLSRPILFANRQYRDKSASNQYSTDTYFDALHSTQRIRQQRATEWVPVGATHKNLGARASDYSQVNDPINQILSLANVGAAEPLEQGLAFDVDPLLSFNRERAADFVVDLHLSQETLFPDSIVSCIYSDLISRIKSIDPYKESVEQLIARNLQSASYPVACSSGASDPLVSRATMSTALNHAKRAHAFGKLAKSINNAQSVPTSRSQNFTTANKWTGYTNIVLPAATMVMNLQEVDAIANNPHDLFAWNGALKFANNSTATVLNAMSLVSSGAGKFAAHIGGPVAATLTTFCRVVDDVRKIRDADEKMRQLNGVLASIYQALTIATTGQVHIGQCYGEYISEGLMSLVRQELKQLHDLVGFVMDRYQLDKNISEAELMVDGYNLAILLISAALSVVTAGASLAVGIAITAVTQGISTIVSSACRLSRYADKTLAFNQKYHDIQQEIAGRQQGGSVRNKALCYRDKNLLDWASELSGKSAYRAKAVNWCASVDIVSGATIDDYQRIQLAAFQISTLVRFKQNESIMETNPLAASYLSIVDALGQCIGYEDGFLTKILLSMRFARRDLSNFDFARSQLDASYKQAVIKLARNIR